MRKTLTALCLALLANAQAPVTESHGQAEFSLAIEAQEDSVKLGSAVTIEVTMKNTSRGDLVSSMATCGW